MIETLKENPALWDLFTKKEEYTPQLVDQYGRFPYYLSRHKEVFRPAVSEHLLQQGWPVHHPGGKTFAVCLTHDIDIVRYNIWRWPYETALAVRDGRFGASWQLLWHRLSKKTNPLWNFTEIMDLEAKYGARSSFYFLALAKGENDFNFRIDELKDELQNIVKRGWEVGLHGSHRAYLDSDGLRREKDRLERVLNQEVIGYRNHYLRFAVPTTWNLLADAGFKYDTTFGYADCAGFRNGMAHPFRPYDLNNDRLIDILEIPLVIMDCTLNEYMQLDHRQAWDLTKSLIDSVEKVNGVITILWHNTYMVNKMRDFYEKILQYCYGKNAWLTSGAEICDWWDKNGFAGQAAG